MIAADITEFLICDAEECLSWIIVLLNLLSVFYLVFCSYFKPTRTVRIFGWVWSAIQIVLTVFVLFKHTCFYTILSTVFTGLVLMAILTVVFDVRVYQVDTPNNNSSHIEYGGGEGENNGFYVIHTTDDNKFCYVLYDSRKKPIAYSYYRYDDIEVCKSHIESSRSGGSSALVEDRTQAWIRDVLHPKFILYRSNDKFQFKLAITNEVVLMISEQFNSYRECLSVLERVKNVIGSSQTYTTTEMMESRDFSLFDATAFLAKQTRVVQAEPRIVQPEVAVQPAAPVAPVIIESTKQEFATQINQIERTYQDYFGVIRKKVQSLQSTNEEIKEDWYVGRVNSTTMIVVKIKDSKLCVFYKKDINKSDSISMIKISNELDLQNVLAIIDEAYKQIARTSI